MLHSGKNADRGNYSASCVKFQISVQIFDSCSVDFCELSTREDKFPTKYNNYYPVDYLKFPYYKYCYPYHFLLRA